MVSLLSVASTITQQQQHQSEHATISKRKPSEIIENAVGKYLKLKATNYNLDKIIEVNTILFLDSLKKKLKLFLQRM
jgi:hypothetical protein